MVHGTHSRVVEVLGTSFQGPLSSLTQPKESHNQKNSPLIGDLRVLSGPMGHFTFKSKQASFGGILMVVAVQTTKENRTHMPLSRKPHFMKLSNGCSINSISHIGWLLGHLLTLRLPQVHHSSFHSLCRRVLISPSQRQFCLQRGKELYLLAIL